MSSIRSQNATRITIVDDTETKPNRQETFSGTAADAWSGEQAFSAIVTRIEILAETNDLEVRFISPDGTVNDSFKVPKNAFRPFDFEARGFEVRNYTPGSNSDYELTGLWREV